MKNGFLLMFNSVLSLLAEIMLYCSHSAASRLFGQYQCSLCEEGFTARLRGPAPTMAITGS